MLLNNQVQAVKEQFIEVVLRAAPEATVTNLIKNDFSKKMKTLISAHEVSQSQRQQDATLIVNAAQQSSILELIDGPKELAESLYVTPTIFGAHLTAEGIGSLISATRTSDDGTVVVGRYQHQDASARGEDGIIVKLDADGNALWLHVLGSPGFDMLTSAVSLDDGNVVFSGHSSASSKITGWLGLVNGNGEIGRQRIIDSNVQLSFGPVVLTRDNQLLVVGSMDINASEPTSGTLICKFDRQLELLWAQFISETTATRNIDVEAMIETTDGNFILAGTRRGEDSDQQAFLGILNAQGTLIRALAIGKEKTTTTSEIKEFLAVTTTAAGSIYAGGFYAHDTIGSDKQAMLVRFTSAGDFEWERDWSNGSYRQVDGIHESDDGNLWLLFGEGAALTKQTLLAQADGEGQTKVVYRLGDSFAPIQLQKVEKDTGIVAGFAIPETNTLKPGVIRFNFQASNLDRHPWVTAVENVADHTIDYTSLVTDLMPELTVTSMQIKFLPTSPHTEDPNSPLTSQMKTVH